jgi:hypothetical protein
LGDSKEFVFKDALDEEVEGGRVSVWEVQYAEEPHFGKRWVLSY